LLQGGRRQTARALAESLEVSMRTVYRDVEALSAAGVPIHMERGAQGGVVLADDYRRALAQFTGDELSALFAAPSEPMTDLGIVGHQRALQKLAGALPLAQRKAAEASRERLLLDHNRWHRDDQPLPLLAALRRAAAEDRRIRLRYRDRNRLVSERLVDPLALVAKAGVWYLVARDVEKGLRTFRAERIAGIDETSERFIRPADFDLDAYWRAAVAEIVRQRPTESYEAVLRMTRHGFERLSYWVTDTHAEDGEFTTGRVRFPSRDAALAWILVLGDAVTIVEPADLTGQLVAYARAALARVAPAVDSTATRG
jgi:predicted DNA-binding transcriptional regulator YafY